MPENWRRIVDWALLGPPLPENWRRIVGWALLGPSLGAASAFAGFSWLFMAFLGWSVPRIKWAPRWPAWKREIVSGLALPFALLLAGTYLALCAKPLPIDKLWQVILDDPTGAFAYFSAKSAELWGFFFLTGFVSVTSRDIQKLLRRRRAQSAKDEHIALHYPFSASRIHGQGSRVKSAR